MATGDPVSGKKLTWTEDTVSYPVQVESAIRDGTGKIIADTYLGKSDTATKAKGLIYLTPTVTTTGVLWSATSSDITSYYDGLMVAVLCPETTATGLTLKINSLDEITIVVNASTNVSTRYAAGSVLVMTYRTYSNTPNWVVMDYDANTNTQMRQYQVTNNTDYSILARYNTTDKTGSYEAAYGRYTLKAKLNPSTGIIKSTQDYVTTNANYPVLFSGTSGTSSTADRELANDALCNTIYVNPSTGQVNATNFNGKHSNLTLTPVTTGFTIAGGTTSKTLTVDADTTISALAPKASPTFTGTVTAAQVLTFSNTSNPYISIKSGSNTYYIQAYDNKLGLGPSWNDSMKIDSSGNVSLTGTPTAPDPGSNPVTTSQIATKNYVDDSIEALPEPMLFKGTLGTGGTITSLPTAAAGNEGWVYKVITDGTYASQAAKIGDLFICANTSTTSTPSYAWTYVPSGDDSASGVTNVATGVGLTGGPITTSGTIKAKLKSETNATYGSETISNMSGRQYAVVPDNPNGYLSVNVPWTDQYVFQNVENSADVDFSVLFTASTTGQTNTGPTHISGGLTYNPSTFTVSAGHFYNFYTNSSLDFIVGSTFQLTEVD